MLEDLIEMQPGAILLSSSPYEAEIDGNGAETLQTVKALCPQAPVISLMKPRPDRFAEFRSPGSHAGAQPQTTSVEQLLQGQFGISCVRML